MKKKAFTLMELLAVIVVLAIILVIAVPRILNIIETTRENSYQLSMDLMRRAAETYVQSGKAEITGSTAVITLNELVNNGYMSPIKDVKDKSTECIGYVEVTIGESGTTYEPCLKCGSNFVSENYDPVLAGEEEPVPENANVHSTTIPDGYTAIYKVEDLNNIRNNLSGNYILMNNLDFNSDSSYTNVANKTTYTTGSGWNPIGNNTTPFTGIFNGNNYKISNLFINRSSTNYIGLFGYINTTNAIVEKLGLESVNVTGFGNVGSLVGFNNYGTVRNTYTTGSVTGNAAKTGGTIGSADGSSTNKALIENNYSIVNVTGTDTVGGLVGGAYSASLLNSYGAGNITASSAISIGVLVGQKGTYYTETNCYKSSDSVVTMPSGTPTTYGISTTSTELKTEAFLSTVLNWNTTNIWDASNYAYPKLGGTTRISNSVSYEIRTIEDLFLIKKDLTGTYTLMNNLDFNSDSNYMNKNNKIAFTTGSGWIPIGNSTTPFTGVFNGNNHIIKNLYINRSGTNYIGLFGYINTTTTLVEKLGLESVNVAGFGNVGSLVGFNNYGTVRNTYTTGSVTGNAAKTGGTIGSADGSSANKALIENNYSIVNVTGTDTVGGLVGGAYSASLLNSYGAGNITASSAISIGVLVGQKGTYYTATNCYRNSDSVVTIPSGTPTTYGVLATSNDLKSLTLTGLNTWNITTIWQINTGAYPTLR